MSTFHASALTIPSELSHELHPDLQLPVLPSDIKKTIKDIGWIGIGIMAAIVTEDEDIVMLVGRDTPKYRAGTLGPLGETSKQIEGISGIPSLVEQPLSTLYRGIGEEMGITEPERLGLRMRRTQGWRINQWPRGDAFPGQWNCAISFAVHIPMEAERLLRTIDPHNDEISGIEILSVDRILNDDPRRYRQGVQSWLEQLHGDGLLHPATDALTPIDFGSVLIGHRDIQIDTP